MVTAIVLIKSERDQISDLAKELLEVKGVAEVYSVAGRYDLVARVKVKQMDELSECIGDNMRKLSGILETETLIAFREFSEQDLAIGFDMGLD